MDNINNHPLYRKHNIDSAMSTLWDFYKARFIPLFVISLVMSLIIQYASTMVNMSELQTMTDPMEMLEAIKDMMLPILIISVVNILFTTILQYYIIYKPLNDGKGFVELAIRSLNYFIPYLIILVLLAVAGSVVIFLGLIALIIGVFFSILYILTIYLFILPIMMIEGPNIANTIQRTISLTHRNFWSNIGWTAVFLIILVVISILFSSIVLLPFTGSFLKTIANPEDAANVMDFAKNPIFIILSSAVSALTMPLMPIFACILYFNGRAGEEEASVIAENEPDNGKVRVEDLYAKPYSDDHEEEEN